MTKSEVREGVIEDLLNNVKYMDVGQDTDLELVVGETRLGKTMFYAEDLDGRKYPLFRLKVTEPMSDFFVVEVEGWGDFQPPALLAKKIIHDEIWRLGMNAYKNIGRYVDREIMGILAAGSDEKDYFVTDDETSPVKTESIIRYGRMIRESHRIRRRTLKEGIASDFEAAAERKYPGYSRKSSEAEPIIDRLANRFVDLQATAAESAEAAIERVLDENEREIRNNLEALAGFFLIGDHFDPEGDNEDLYLDVRDLLADLLAEFATDGLDESAGKWHITVDGKDGGKLFDTLSSAKRTAEKMRERGEDGKIEIRKTDDDDFCMKVKSIGR